MSQKGGLCAFGHRLRAPAFGRIPGLLAQPWRDDRRPNRTTQTARQRLRLADLWHIRGFSASSQAVLGRRQTYPNRTVPKPANRRDGRCDVLDEVEGANPTRRHLHISPIPR
jgi:hypothetical protein